MAATGATVARPMAIVDLKPGTAFSERLLVAVFDILRIASWPVLGFALVLFLVSAIGLAVIVALRVQRARMLGRGVSAEPSRLNHDEPPAAASAPADSAIASRTKPDDFDIPDTGPRHGPAPVGSALSYPSDGSGSSGAAPATSPLQPVLRFRPAAPDERPAPVGDEKRASGVRRLLPAFARRDRLAESVSSRRRRRRTHRGRRRTRLRWIAAILGLGVLAMGTLYALTPWIDSMLVRESEPVVRIEGGEPMVPAPAVEPMANDDGEAELRRAVELRAAERFADARAAYDRARALFARAGSGRLQADALVGQGDMALAMRDYEAARLSYGEARSIYSRDGNLLGGANVTAALGRLELSVGRMDRAREMLEDARRLYMSEGSPQGEANVLLGLAEIAAPVDPALAREHLQDAAKLYELVGMPEWRDMALRRAEAVESR